MPSSRTLKLPVVNTSLPNIPSIATLARELDGPWSKGWHPMDIARLLDSDARTLAVFVDSLTLARTGWHPQAGSLWTDQADALGAISPWWHQDKPYWPQFRHRHDAVGWQPTIAIDFLRLLNESARAQPLFEAPPSEPGWNDRSASANDGVLSKVRALLAKAESSEFEHEAEALSAKAQQLITRHSIDVALLAETVDVPGGRKLYLEAPYAKSKYVLLAAIAGANNCRCVWSASTKTATLIGHQVDMQLVELLFTSLLLQGTAAILAESSRRQGSGSARVRSWRNAFWFGFADRIGERLSAATEEAQLDHEAAQSVDLLPVLARRSQAVDDALSEAFPKLGTMRSSVSNRQGIEAGKRFADRAEIDASQQVRGRKRHELSP